VRRSLRPAGKRTRLAGLLVLSVVFAGACSSADGRDEASRQSSAQPDVNDPALQVTAPTLAFGANQTAQTITLENAGGGSLTWSARVDETWVSIQPSQGTTTTEVDWFSVNVDRAGLAAGAYAATVELETNVGSKTFSLTMNVVTPNEE
jgi:hypothetical protein